MSNKGGGFISGKSSGVAFVAGDDGFADTVADDHHVIGIDSHSDIFLVNPLLHMYESIYGFLWASVPHHPPPLGAVLSHHCIHPLTYCYRLRFHRYTHCFHASYLVNGQCVSDMNGNASERGLQGSS